MSWRDLSGYHTSSLSLSFPDPDKLVSILWFLWLLMAFMDYVKRDVEHIVRTHLTLDPQYLIKGQIFSKIVCKPRGYLSE